MLFQANNLMLFQGRNVFCILASEMLIVFCLGAKEFPCGRKTKAKVELLPVLLLEILQLY